MKIKLPDFKLPYYVNSSTGRLVIRLCELAGRTANPVIPKTEKRMGYCTRFIERPEGFLMLTDLAASEAELHEQHRDGIIPSAIALASGRWPEIFAALCAIPGVMISG